MERNICATIFYCLIICYTYAHVELDYYWVDFFDGDLPSNPLKVDSNNSRYGYVGQVFSKDGLLPASVYTSKPYAVFSARGKSLTADKNIKVLCSQFRGQFVWVKTNASSYLNIPNMVVGGTEENSSLYIGRVKKSSGKTFLGKVGSVLSIPINGQEEQIYECFDVLTYNKLKIGGD